MAVRRAVVAAAAVMRMTVRRVAPVWWARVE
jgi:hypothetical protein